MKCSTCEIETEFYSESTTLVGYSSNCEFSEHDDNCIKRYYHCSNNHDWIESIIRTCKCGWRGKEECSCHGKKVEQWTDLPLAEIGYDQYKYDRD